MTAEDISEHVFKKFDKLKFFKDLDDDAKNSVNIILEHTLKHHLEKIMPTIIQIKPIFKLDRDCLLKPENDNNKYKLHLFDVGDRIIVPVNVATSIYSAIRYFVKTHQPTWVFFKEKNTSENTISFKRVK